MSMAYIPPRGCVWLTCVSFLINHDMIVVSSYSLRAMKRNILMIADRKNRTIPQAKNPLMMNKGNNGGMVITMHATHSKM